MNKTETKATFTLVFTGDCAAMSRVCHSDPFEIKPLCDGLYMSVCNGEWIGDDCDREWYVNHSVATLGEMLRSINTMSQSHAGTLSDIIVEIESGMGSAYCGLDASRIHPDLAVNIEDVSGYSHDKLKEARDIIDMLLAGR